MQQFINQFYKSELGIPDYSSLSWREQERIDELLKQKIQLESMQGQKEFHSLPFAEQQKRTTKAKFIELKLERLEREMDELDKSE